MRLLVVEDERKIATFISKGLREAGFTVECCERGERAMDLLLTETYDAVVLDVMLPGRDGLSILKELRSTGRDIPVLLLTARSGLEEKLEGLNQGADDYLPKPFHLEELIARIHAITRRHDGRTASILKAGHLSLDLITREVRVEGKIVEMTAREFNLLEKLVRSPGRVYSRTLLYEQVWDYNFDPSTNLVDVYIRRIRSKIDKPNEPSIIETVRGVGYRFRKE